MIFESKDEKNAFEFICNICSDTISASGCDDLEADQLKMFGHLKVESEDGDGSKFMRPVVFGGDVLYWLEQQVKK